jgi:TolB-like protein
MNIKFKHLCAVLAILAMAVLAMGSGASAPKADTGQDELDMAIRDTSDYLNDNIPKGSKIVILNIQSDYPDLSDYIIDELIANTVNDKNFSVVDRQQLDIIRAERNFQWSGEVNDSDAVEIGKTAGAQTIVSGAIGPLGERHRLRIRALEVQTAQVQGQYNRNMNASPILTDLMKSGGTGTRTAAATSTSRTPASGTAASSGAGGQTAQQPAASAEPATSTPTAYKVGDTGPAGGFIFYDKGNNNNGWRYLEAAPVEGESSRTRWRVTHNTKVDNTSAAIGSGRRNTQLIVEVLSKTSGEWDNAAQKADDLVLNGFDDWFLPSKDELDQMYGNLKRRNLGDFKNADYWSSTIQSEYIAYQSFGNGGQDNTWSGTQGHYIRPIRQVAGQ